MRRQRIECGARLALGCGRSWNGTAICSAVRRCRREMRRCTRLCGRRRPAGLAAEAALRSAQRRRSTGSSCGACPRSPCAHRSTCVCARAHERARVGSCVCACILRSTDSVCAHVCACVCACVRVCVRARARLCVCARARACACACAYAWMRACVCVRLCACMCVRASVRANTPIGSARRATSGAFSHRCTLRYAPTGRPGRARTL